MQARKLLGNRRNAYILGVICNRFYFEEVQEDVLAQYNRQGITVSIKEDLPVYQWSVPEKNEQGGWENAFANTPLRFLGLSLKSWENQILLQVWFHKSMQEPLKKPRPKKGTPKLYGFLLITHALPNSLQEVPYAITSTGSYFYVFKPIV